MASLWPFPVDWSSAVETSYEFRTEVFTSRSGREQRRALRQNPRMAIESTHTVQRDEFRRFDALMSTSAPEFVVPDFSEVTRLSARGFAGAQFVTVTRVPWWAVAGAQMVLEGWGRASELLTLQSVSGDRLNLTSGLAQTWEVGSPLRLGRLARVASSPTNMLLPDAARARVRFEVDIAAARFRPPEAPRGGYDGREVFMHRPDWSSPPRRDYESGREVVDYGFGRQAFFNEQPFISRSMQMDFLGVDADPALYDPTDRFWASRLFLASENTTGQPVSAFAPASAASLIDVFRRMKGMRGELFVPTWSADMQAVGGIVESESTLDVAGRRVFDEYRDDPAHKAIALILPDRTSIFRRVIGMSVVGGNTRLAVDAAWSETTSDFSAVCWLPMCRFASDTLTLSWRTNLVAEMSVNFRSLETLDV